MPKTLMSTHTISVKGELMEMNLNPKLFARLMLLPESRRLDILGFAAAAALESTHLEKLISDVEKPGSDYLLVPA